MAPPKVVPGPGGMPGCAASSVAGCVGQSIRAGRAGHPAPRPSPPLPTSSSDVSAIKELWSKVKQSLRKLEARSHKSLYETLGHVTAQDTVGRFQHDGLCATHGRFVLTFSEID